MAKIYKKSVSARKNITASKKWCLVGAAVLLVAVVTALELTNKTYWFHHRQAISGVVPSTSPKNGSNTSSDKSTVPSYNDNSSKTTTSKDQSSTTSSNLTAPWGTFVSNNTPNLDSQPYPSGEQSVCLTTPGAACYIQFTKGDVTIKLGSKTADQNGQVIWNWDINDRSGSARFTEGSWKITAVATLNGATKTTVDSMNLEIGP
jgi:hypothetical protein